MKKLMLMMGLLIAGAFIVPVQAASVALLSEGVVAVAAASTNNSSDVRLATGSDSIVVSPTGKGSVGVGIVRALTYSVTGSLTNGTIVFYPYDAGVKGSAIYSATGVTAGGNGRFNLTNTLYTGRLKVEVYQTTATNAASTWAWGAIVE